MGQVLIRFDRDLFIERLGITGDDAQILMREVFLSLEWSRMDRGSLTDEEGAEIMCRRVPSHLHDAVRKLTCMWDRPILPVPGMAELVRELRENGYHVYLLSNASFRQHEYWPRVPGSAYFEDTLISADTGLVKPQPEIFRAACEKFHIAPEESVFIDDSTANCEGAFYIGMQACVFHGDADETRLWLIDHGVNLRRIAES